MHNRVTAAGRSVVVVASSGDADTGGFVPRRRRRNRDGADAPTRRPKPGDGEDDEESRRRQSDELNASSTSASMLRRAYASEDELFQARDAVRQRERAVKAASKAAFKQRVEACERVVVVEGGADVRAVRGKAGADHASAKVLAVRHKGAFKRPQNGEMDVKKERLDEIERLSVKYDAPIVVLFDCDTAGRQLRNAFLRRFPDALHAFIGTRASSAKEDGKWHAVGNVGVEHAEGDDITHAIDSARRADPDRRVFTRTELVDWGLVADESSGDDSAWREYGGVVNRRRLVGEYLGVGDCDGRQLLRQMNLYFTEDEVRQALDSLPGRGEAVPEKMTDGRADRRRRKSLERGGDADDDFAALGFDPMAYIPPGQVPPGFE
jgi:5S rRNA maturation endonuclease (ribonuclease M5)